MTPFPAIQRAYRITWLTDKDFAGNLAVHVGLVSGAKLKFSVSIRHHLAAICLTFSSLALPRLASPRIDAKGSGELVCELEKSPLLLPDNAIVWMNTDKDANQNGSSHTG